MYGEASLSERLERLLRFMAYDCPGVEAAALVSYDGLIMASSLEGDADEDRVAAMSAALLSVAEKIGAELDRGEFETALVSGSKGFVVVKPVNGDALLVVLAGKNSKLGLIKYEMSRIGRMLAEELERTGYG